MGGNMVWRRALDRVNRVGRLWENVTQGTYSNAASSRGDAEELRTLLAAVVADWPPDAPATPALLAAREYLRRAEGSAASSA